MGLYGNNLASDFDLKYVEVDVQGRYVLVEANAQGSNFLFVNFYAPAEDA